MLSRAVLPLARARPLPPTIRLSIASQHPRWYAKNNNKNKAGYKLPESIKASKSQSAPPSSATNGTTKKSEQADFSKQQPEFETGSKSSENTAPQSAGAGAGVTEAKTTKSSSQADQSSEQVEFESTAQPKENTSDQPQKPLPDLTQGIPSTLAAELEAASHPSKKGATALNLTEDPSRSEGYGDEDAGDMPKDAYVSSLDRRRARMANVMYALFLAGAIAGTVYLGRNWETEAEANSHADAPSGWGFGQFYSRIKARLNDLTSYYKDPAFEKLLPDEDPQLRQPYTLVLSLEDLLVHSEWSREHGWRVAKRPGVDYFLRYLNQYYELVLFTSVPSMMADQVLKKLDPYRIIRWPLFREATKYKDGEYVKDLSYLNRDLSKVILIDTVEGHAKEQPENAIILPKWKGDPKDKSLVALIPFLEYMAGMGIEDVRPVLKSFEGTSIPVEFAKREKIMREKFEKQLAEERAKRPKRNVGSLASLLGLKSQHAIDGEPSTAEGLAQGKMLWDQIRERGQKNYEFTEQQIRENGEKWLAEMAAEEQKAIQEQMKSMRGSLTGFFGGGGNQSK